MAYQGAGHLFARVFDGLKLKYKFIKSISDLNDDLTFLIMPGGESSVQADFLNRYGFVEKILNMKINVLGTCAGMILLSSYKSKLFNGFGIFDVDLERNFYGSQVESVFYKSDKGNEICFIRAPAISKINDKEIEVLDTHREKPILIRKDNFYASSFHPEISQSSKYEVLMDLIFKKL